MCYVCCDERNRAAPSGCQASNHAGARRSQQQLQQAMRRDSTHLVLRACTAVLTDTISVLGQVTSAPDADQFDKLLAENSESSKQFLTDSAVLCASPWWKQSESGPAEERELRDAVDVLRLAWQVFADGHISKVLRGETSCLLVDSLSRILSIVAFSQARACVDRRVTGQ